MRHDCAWNVFVFMYGQPVRFEPADCRPGERLHEAWLHAMQYRKLWTVVEGDDGESWHVCDGHHPVNRITYLVTPAAVPPDVAGQVFDIDGIDCEVVDA